MLVAVLVFFSVYSGIREVDQRLVERVQTLGGGRGRCCARSTCPR